MPQRIIALVIAFFIGGSPALPATTASGKTRSSTSTTSTTASTATGPATVARLDIQVSTTSDWTAVTFSPGRVATFRIDQKTGVASMDTLEQGWGIHPTPGTPASLTIRAVFEERTIASNITITIDKGMGGRTDLDVVNRNGAPFTVAHLANISHANPATQRTVRTRAAFFGAADPVIPRADSRRLVLADYYPWFSSYDNPALADRPQGMEPTDQYPGVLAMTQQAKANGIDGFVVSWQGNTPNGLELDLALSAARAAGTVVTIYLEMVGANPTRDTAAPTSSVTVKQRLSEALARAGNTAFLRSGGVPVVFVFEMGRIGPLQWRAILDQLAQDGTPVRLVGDAPLDRYGDVNWGLQRYSPGGESGRDMTRWNRSQGFDSRLLATSGAVTPHLFVATVSPGYDDHRLRGNANPIIPRDNGARYQLTWGAALDCSADWILVTSWNEWYEGSAVQPGQANGDLALRQTATYAAQFKS